MRSGTGKSNEVMAGRRTFYLGDPGGIEHAEENMNRAMVVVSAVISGVLIGACIGTSGSAEPPLSPQGLPGARAVVDAAKYPSLQAAIDAVPAEGGMVTLPPGTFEIDKPLLVTKGDVLLRGSGMATHIKNMNTFR